MKALLFVSLILLAGCDMPVSYDPIQSRQAVVDAFKTSDVAMTYHWESGSTAVFVVRAPDGAIWYVSTESNKVTSQTCLFSAKQ